MGFVKSAKQLVQKIIHINIKLIIHYLFEYLCEKRQDTYWLIVTFYQSDLSSCGQAIYLQPVITPRIYVLHKITIALKFMFYINFDLPIPEKKLQTPSGQVASNVTNVINSSQIKSTQLATHIFSNLVTHVDFLQLQGYISIQQASGFDSNFARINFQKFLSYSAPHLGYLYLIHVPSASYQLYTYLAGFCQHQLVTTNFLSINKDLAGQ